MRRRQDWRCTCIQKLMAAELCTRRGRVLRAFEREEARWFASTPFGGCFHGKYFIIHNKSC
jgi:hypothetical protein